MTTGRRRPPDQAPSIGYISALDGLRALAMLGILIFHAFPAVLPGGFIGVDVFFVLSGFLVASLIVHETREGVFSFREFYLRRIQRLVPNAVLTVLVTVLLWLWVLTPTATVKTARLGLAALFGLSNVYLTRSVGGYWGEAASSYPLTHTWALAVEIQFYVLFPVLLWLLLRRSTRLAQAVLGGLAALSLVLAVIGSRMAPEAAFYLFPSRAWQLLLGAMLAIAWDRRVRGASRPSKVPGSWLEAGGWVGLITILVGFALIASGVQLLGLVGLVPTVGALLVIVSVAEGRGNVARLLSWRPAVALGKASYSLFLWHLPFIVLGSTYANFAGWPHYLGVIGGASVGVLLSLVAYKWVETPLRRRGPGRSWRLVVSGVGFVLCVILVAALSFWRPVADRDDLFDQVVYRGRAYDLIHVEPTLADTGIGARFADVLFPVFEKRAAQSWEDGGIVHSYGGASPAVVVIGSSHALMYAGQIDDICKELGQSVAFLTVSGNLLFEPSGEAAPGGGSDLTSYYEARNRWVAEWRPDVVVMIDRWDAADPATLATEVHRLVTELQRSAGTVLALTQPPVLRLGESVNLREYVTWYRQRHSSLPSIAPDSNEDIRQSAAKVLEAEAQKNAGFQLIRADHLFYNQDGSVHYSQGRIFYYADDDHLAESGAALLRKPLAEAIASACRVPMVKTLQETTAE